MTNEHPEGNLLTQVLRKRLGVLIRKFLSLLTKLLDSRMGDPV